MGGLDESSEFGGGNEGDVARTSAPDDNGFLLVYNLIQNLANVLDQIVDQQETVVVRRRGARDVALLPAAELAGLIETAHLLRSPRNARRLLAALRRAEQGKTKPGTAAGLRREILGEARS